MTISTGEGWLLDLCAAAALGERGMSLILKLMVSIDFKLVLGFWYTGDIEIKTLPVTAWQPDS